MRSLATTVLALLSAAALACAADAPARKPLCPDCNVVLIGIDDVRADAFRVLGATDDVVPSLNRFAGTAVGFTQAISAAPWSLPSFMSIFTGTFPFSHHMTNKYADFNADPMVLSKLSVLSPDMHTLGQLLHDQGYRAAGFTGGAALTGSFGFSTGFEVYDDSVTFGGFDRSVPEALEWLSKLGPKDKFFLFVHGYDAHAFHPEHFPPGFEARFRQMRDDHMQGKPVKATPEEQAVVRRAYWRGLTVLDEHLKPLLDRLNDPALGKRTVVVVLADHGEELFDHGGLDHGMTLYDELIHVPFFIRIPGVPPRLVTQQVRTVDLLPTLFAALGMPADWRLQRQLRGVSLLPTLHGQQLNLNAFAETDFLLQVSLRAMRTHNGWKYIYDRYKPDHVQLYQLGKDPKERHEVAPKFPDVARVLKSSILLTFQGQ